MKRYCFAVNFSRTISASRLQYNFRHARIPTTHMPRQRSKYERVMTWLCYHSPTGLAQRIVYRPVAYAFCGLGFGALFRDTPAKVCTVRRIELANWFRDENLRQKDRQTDRATAVASHLRPEVDGVPWLAAISLASAFLLVGQFVAILV